NRPAFYNNDDDDDVDYTIAITPVLSTEKPDNSLIMKSSVKDLVPIPSEFEFILDTMCDVHLVNNPTPLEANDHFEIFINSNDDYSSSNEDSLYNDNIEYVEASPHDELVSLEVAEIVISKDKEIEDDNLREKLLNLNLLIAKIEALKDNPTISFEFLTKNLPDLGELISILNSRIRENLSSTTRVNLPVKDDHSPLLAYVSDGDVVFHLLPYGPMNSGSIQACDSVNKNKAFRGRHPMLISS
nr:hypothetical protein [Tanacetum cinerariifolium]